MRISNRSIEMIFTMVLSAPAIVCCSSKSPEKEVHGDHRVADDGHAEASHGEASHHHEAEMSDLDRPLSALFADVCEHTIKTYECDECRYEVGVVKADADLFKGGLIKTERAEKRAVSVPLKLTGEAAFDERRVAHVSTLAEGIIKKVHVTLGDRVQKGQALIEIESVGVGDSEAAYLEAEGLLRLAKQDRERVSSLREEGIASEKEMLAASQTLDAAQIRMEAALGRLTRLGMSRKKTLSLTRSGAEGRLILRAPVDGTVLAMHAVAGETAHSETALLTIGDNTSLWIWADLYEENIAAVTKAQAHAPLSAAVTVKAFADEIFWGTVDFVSPSMSGSSRTVKVRIAVPNPNGLLLSGMFADVALDVPGGEVGVTVPSKAVLWDEGRSFVFVHHEGDYYVRRPLRVRRNVGEFAEIESGLKGDETVVTDGAFLMKSDVLRSKMGAGCAD